MSGYKLGRMLMIVVLLTVASTSPAGAHCDALDGPVVTLAKKALETGNINPILSWVAKADEPEIRRAFEQSRAVRKLGPEAKTLADTFFFETVVRVHRASEGAPFTGLKAAGLDLGPAIPAADRALNTESTEAVEKLLMDAIHKGLRAHFDAVVSRKKFDPNDVAAGREYVEAYVPYIHYVEGLWEMASATARGHFPEASDTQPAPHTH